MIVMNTVTAKESKATTSTVNKEVGAFIGELYSFNNSLKLYHWHVSGSTSLSIRRWPYYRIVLTGLPKPRMR